jgi:hypothetical protein
MTTTAATEVKEHPVLFSGPMIRAILEGRKTQTRRVIKPQPGALWGKKTFAVCREPDDYEVAPGTWMCFQKWDVMGEFTEYDATPIGKCPYGKPGDRLWVRETWRPQHPYDLPGQEKPIYAADWTPEEFEQIYGKTWGWKPSIFMPRWASRITLEVVNVRVERLQAISEEDAMAEGAPGIFDGPAFGYAYPHTQGFKALWESINGKKYPWVSNPFVWCISFRRVDNAELSVL